MEIELLSPAGSFEKLKFAFKYGADAVYIGAKNFSLRAKAQNFEIEEIKRAVKYAHVLGKKIYLAANVFAHNSDLEEWRQFLKDIRDEVDFDAIILSDLGMFNVTRKIVDVDIHISTQANNVNFESANLWYELGAKRIILARELSLSEIQEIRGKVPEELELEVFIHGSMCISYSGRCLLSNYMAGRSSNLGDCAQPCRWKYKMVEEKRPNDFFEINEENKSTFILNSKDLCMIEHIPDLVKTGVKSFKIEGRMKSEYYLSVVTKTYKKAINCYLNDPERYEFDPKWKEELLKISHRHYTTGFYYEKDADSENYESSSYVQNYNPLAIVKSYDEKNELMIVVQKNRFSVGDLVEIVTPDEEEFVVEEIALILNENNEVIEVANRPNEIVKVKISKKVPPFSIIRKRVK